VAPHCAAYLAEKGAKTQTEGLRAQARDALNNYRQNIFPAYQGVINDYLVRFNAGLPTPPHFSQARLLGLLLAICEQRVNTPAQILGQADIAELRALLDYANLFHHNSNPAWATQVINDQALVNFAQRTLAFARR